MRINKLVVIAALVLISACKKDDNTGANSTSLGGDGNLSTNAVGYTYNCTTNIPGLTIDEGKVLSNNNGEVTINIKATLPANHPLTNLMPDELVDATGKVNITQTYKNTSEGILDYTNGDHKPFVIIRYDGSVGDKYLLTRNNGSSITRTITYKSSTDEYPYGFMLIKVMKVEQNLDQYSNMPGFKKSDVYRQSPLGSCRDRV